ncbi:hypothetical protein [Actinacidiphila soli]|uniref:hypothetical protein n=1 Tax=Actinacidiphila soli TaxID=2487275 RepID=UPI0013E39128|nr:hypothetical protein [Actinacidiphila soli]
MRQSGGGVAGLAAGCMPLGWDLVGARRGHQDLPTVTDDDGFAAVLGPLFQCLPVRGAFGAMDSLSACCDACGAVALGGHSSPERVAPQAG